MTRFVNNIHHPIIIGIAGGIGSGKSVVSRLLRLRGYRVYDCDSEARRLMTCSESLKESIASVFGKKAIDADGQLDRSFLAERIFGDSVSRRELESIVHPVVRNDIEQWAAKQPDGKPVFVESAILVTSGISEFCSAIILVEAERGERIRRIRLRDNWKERDIIRRIDSQQKEADMLEKSDRPICRIDNSGTESILEQIDSFLSRTVIQPEKECICFVQT